MSFAAITLPCALLLSGCLFLRLLSDMRGFLIEEQCIGFRFCFRLGKTASGTPEMLRKLPLTKPMLVHGRLCDFLGSDLGGTSIKDCGR